MTKRRGKSKKPIVTDFRVGDKVRVKHGVTDVEYADMPMGGWAGTVTDVDKRGVYTVRWSRETLLEAKKGNPNRQLIADYAYWFWNWR